MSAQHTPGRLAVRGGYSIYTTDGTPVADTCLTASIPDNDEANARRLVACWNACEGIQTELLEHYYGDRGGLDAALDQASLRDHTTAVQQRDELLAALKMVQSQCESMVGADWRKWEELASPEEFERWVKSRASHMAVQASAAIAKVEGGAA